MLINCVRSIWSGLADRGHQEVWDPVTCHPSPWRPSSSRSTTWSAPSECPASSSVRLASSSVSTTTSLGTMTADTRQRGSYLSSGAPTPRRCLRRWRTSRSTLEPMSASSASTTCVSFITFRSPSCEESIKALLRVKTMAYVWSSFLNFTFLHGSAFRTKHNFCSIWSVYVQT